MALKLEKLNESIFCFSRLVWCHKAPAGAENHPGPAAPASRQVAAFPVGDLEVGEGEVGSVNFVYLCSRVKCYCKVYLR